MPSISCSMRPSSLTVSSSSTLLFRSSPSRSPRRRYQIAPQKEDKFIMKRHRRVVVSSSSSNLVTVCVIIIMIIGMMRSASMTEAAFVNQVPTITKPAACLRVGRRTTRKLDTVSFQPCISHHVSNTDYLPFWLLGWSQHQYLHGLIGLGAKHKSNDGRDDNDDPQQLGMAESFRQLESLDSLGDDTTELTLNAPSPPIALSPDQTEPLRLAAVPLPPPEHQIQVFAEMVQELERQTESDRYQDVMIDIQTSSNQSENKNVDDNDQPSVPFITNITTTPKITVPSNSSQLVTPPSVINVDLDTPDAAAVAAVAVSLQDTEEFMNQALQEAMKEVQVRNPTLSESLLNDAEIMKQIEAIFDKGNEQLIARLDEIRMEQQIMAQTRAKQNSQQVVNDMTTQDTDRLIHAEATMSTMLRKVSQETLEVEKAVNDLNRAQSELDQNVLYKLKSGGILKQTAFVGFVLFSVRSIVDSIAAVQTDESTILTSALIQGGIAFICAAIVFFL